MDSLWRDGEFSQVRVAAPCLPLPDPAATHPPRMPSKLLIPRVLFSCDVFMSDAMVDVRHDLLLCGEVYNERRRVCACDWWL